MVARVEQGHPRNERWPPGELWSVLWEAASTDRYLVLGPRSAYRRTDKGGYTILQLRRLCSEGKVTAGIRYYNYGICVQTQRQGRLYNITTVAYVFRLKDDEGYAIVKPSVSFTNVWLCAPVDGKNIRVSASVSVRMANKQTYNHKTYNTSMDQANQC